MAGDRIVLITGATGKQGGAVLRELMGKGFRLRAMTRKPEGDVARALGNAGVEIVTGDFDVPESLSRAFEGVWGLFAMQNTWEAGVQREEEQGKRVATIARERGVQHFVYTSVGSAHLNTGIPHFDNKARVEETVRALKFPSHVIIRPVFFMENLTTPWFLNGDKIYTAMDPKTVLQMIAVEDIGRYGAAAFVDAARLNGREIDLAGDALTMPAATALLGRELGRTIEFVRIPIEEVRKNSEDFALMLEWFDKVGYTADMPALRREFGFAPTTFAQWAATQRQASATGAR